MRSAVYVWDAETEKVCIAFVIIFATNTGSIVNTAKQLAGLIMEVDLPKRALERVAELERMGWQEHIKAAIIDLRHIDRSPFEQQVYEALRSFAEQHFRQSGRMSK